MHRLWNALIAPALHARQSRRIVEIGAADGLHTRSLLNYCHEVGGHVDVIDPVVSPALAALIKEHGTFCTLRQERSIDALPQIAGYDTVLIDGDHNWYTVFHELLLIEQEAKRSGAFPLVLLHDTQWPYARRDMYHRPEDIPEAFVQAYAAAGMVPGETDLQENSGINRTVWNACHEGGQHNGVLTALEDFLAQTTCSITSMHIPGLHGLSIVGPKHLLEAMDRNRDLHIACMEGHRLQELLAVEERETTIRQLQDHIGVLKQQHNTAQRTIGELSHTIDHIMHTRSWKLTHWLRRFFHFL